VQPDRKPQIAGLKGSPDGTAFHFGQPVAGFFFVKESFTASFQSLSILSRSGFGPGGAFLTGSFSDGLANHCAALYISRFPSADLTASTVLSPSFSLRLFHTKSNCQRYRWRYSLLTL